MPLRPSLLLPISGLSPALFSSRVSLLMVLRDHQKFLVYIMSSQQPQQKFSLIVPNNIPRVEKHGIDLGYLSNQEPERLAALIGHALVTCQFLEPGGVKPYGSPTPKPHALEVGEVVSQGKYGFWCQDIGKWMLHRPRQQVCNTDVFFCPFKYPEAYQTIL